MNEETELFIKKVNFLVEKYFFTKHKIMYLIKGLIGGIILWILTFFSLFGGFTNYKKLVDENVKQISASESLRHQAEDLVSNPLFIGGMVEVIIISFVIGYLGMCIFQIIFDLIRGKVFQGFKSEKINLR
ncbi:hypothetical protein [Enterococcus faecium]|uniref:hypothetical protein n=1 Tax=Enterococcus faecium TaxID=1352 RepID=UPI000AF90F9A|nr:hypothetical protein [Enterococcus faecium]MBK0922776.1 hypothetical protein [Enterococcus faecium]MCU7635491.1 hypothetical protein [Enterococcus faecium]MCZ1700894.1 hypothetical protein [Enterococcus faecium]MCZ1712093.1 hypothetical protein [Enterococcus faecium]MDT0279146.1 hypothetical protein [Enterococcus faecium]